MAVEKQCPAVPDVAGDDAARTRYIARFDDGDSALMHAHQQLRRRLVDVDAGLYRCGLARAVAAVESIGLSHRRIYLDPSIDEQTLVEIDAQISSLTAKRQRTVRFWNMVGYLALLFLLLQAVIGLL